MQVLAAEEFAGIADTTVAVTAEQTEADGIVSLDQLANYKSIKKKMTNDEFQAAYDAALGIVQPLMRIHICKSRKYKNIDSERKGCRTGVSSGSSFFVH